MPSPEGGRPPLLARALTIWRLGLVNVARVAVRQARYRLGRFLTAPRWGGVGSPSLQRGVVRTPPDDPAALAEAEALLAGTMLGFGGRPVALEFPVGWQLNRLSGRTTDFSAPWFRASDFDADFGDIKGAWEASRFDWALVLARAAAQGHAAAFDRLNALLADWCEHNRPYRGLNWMCGQETSIRLVQLMLAARLVGDDGGRLAGFVSVHVERILDTIGYAIAQDNDHGFTETSGLFIGGEWLRAHGSPDQRRLGAKASRVGRRWLENRVGRLVLDDGGTSNYSSNYHRTIVDWLCQAELWRQAFGAPAFSDRFYERAARAARCLDVLTNEASGGAPNIGANDGAWVFRLHGLPYANFRPSVQLAAAVFLKQRRYPAGPWDMPLAWWGLDPGSDVEPCAKTTERLDAFGLLALATGPGGSYGYLRVPRARFRPPQADPLHFDLWTADGLNLLIDSGSYSYFDVETAEQHCGIAGHNTVEFDGHEPMRRLSRFLYVDWIEASVLELGQHPEGVTASATYRDRFGCRLVRTIVGSPLAWTITDRLEGFERSAILRWRLCDAPWTLDANRLVGAAATLEVSVTGSPVRLELTTGGDARAYGVRTPTPLLLAHVSQARCEIVTRISLA